MDLLTGWSLLFDISGSDFEPKVGQRNNRNSVNSPSYKKTFDRRLKITIITKSTGYV